MKAIRLKWCGYVIRRDEEYTYVGKRMMTMEVPGTRRRGRPKRRWLHTIQFQDNDVCRERASRFVKAFLAAWESL